MKASGQSTLAGQLIDYVEGQKGEQTHWDISLQLWPAAATGDTYNSLCPEQLRSCSSSVLVTHRTGRLEIQTACLFSSCLTVTIKKQKQKPSHFVQYSKWESPLLPQEGTWNWSWRDPLFMRSTLHGRIANDSPIKAKMGWLISTSLPAKNSRVLGGRKGWQHCPMTTVSPLCATEIICCSRSQMFPKGLWVRILVPSFVLLSNKGTLRSTAYRKAFGSLRVHL